MKKVFMSAAVVAMMVAAVSCECNTTEKCEETKACCDSTKTVQEAVENAAEEIKDAATDAAVKAVDQAADAAKDALKK